MKVVVNVCQLDYHSPAANTATGFLRAPRTNPPLERRGIPTWHVVHNCGDLDTASATGPSPGTCLGRGSTCIRIVDPGVIVPPNFAPQVQPEFPISSRLDPSDEPSSPRAIVVLLTNAANLPTKLTKPSVVVVNWCSRGVSRSPSELGDRCSDGTARSRGGEDQPVFRCRGRRRGTDPLG